MPTPEGVPVAMTVPGSSVMPEDSSSMMAAALSDRCYRDLPAELRDRLRATQLKTMLTAYAVQQGA